MTSGNRIIIMVIDSLDAKSHPTKIFGTAGNATVTAAAATPVRNDRRLTSGMSLGFGLGIRKRGRVALFQLRAGFAI